MDAKAVEKEALRKLKDIEAALRAGQEIASPWLAMALRNSSRLACVARLKKAELPGKPAGSQD